MFNLNFNKSIQNIQKLDQELRALNVFYTYCSIKGSELNLYFSQVLTQEQVNTVSNLVNNFVETSVVEYIKENTVVTVDAWINDLLKNITAENIAMGITQAGKTADVVGFYQNYVLLPGKTFPCTFKGSLDTRSLNVTAELLTYYIANPQIYEGLDPFVTPERLTEWRTKILRYLGVIP